MPNQRIERVRDGVLLASGDVPKNDIAKIIGCSPSAVGALIHRRIMGRDLSEKLEEWLEEQGYLGRLADGAPQKPQGESTARGGPLAEVEAIGRSLAATAGAGGPLTPGRLGLIRGAADRLCSEVLPELEREARG